MAVNLQNELSVVTYSRLVRETVSQYREIPFVSQYKSHFVSDLIALEWRWYYCQSSVYWLSYQISKITFQYVVYYDIYMLQHITSGVRALIDAKAIDISG